MTAPERPAPDPWPEANRAHLAAALDRLHRRLDALSLLVLAGIVLSLLAFFGGGGPRMLQLREKLVTGVIGLAFLASAAVGRPLIYELARAGMARSGSRFGISTPITATAPKRLSPATRASLLHRSTNSPATPARARAR